MQLITFIDFLKIVALVQIILVIGLLLWAYGLKIYAYYQHAQQQKTILKLNEAIKLGLKNPQNFTTQTLKINRRHLSLLIDVITQWDNQLTLKDQSWQTIRQDLLSITQPQLQWLATSTEWYERYLACLTLSLFEQCPEESILLKLIQDPIPLIAINAAKLALQSNSKALVNAVIDLFAEGRRVQQSFYTQIITGANPSIMPFINERLCHEKNPYILAFCYRALTALPPRTTRLETITRDSESNNIDLRLAVLSYRHHQHDSTLPAHLLALLQEKHWEIRARAAKLLGLQQNSNSAAFLEQSLCDPVWWVRLNAAEALYQLGEPGRLILQNQTPEKDRFAYDAAKLILSTTSKHIDPQIKVQS